MSYEEGTALFIRLQGYTQCTVVNISEFNINFVQKNLHVNFKSSVTQVSVWAAYLYSTFFLLLSYCWEKCEMWQKQETT